MGSITNLRAYRSPKKTGGGTRYVHCAHCNERHPFVRLANGTVRCVTAFTDGVHWFCRERGCYSGWLSAH